MKLTKSEFEAQLKLAKSLPAEARGTMIATLKAAQVVEVDEKGAETPVTVEIIEAEPVAKAAAVGLDEAQVKSLIADAVAKAARPVTGAAAVTQVERKSVEIKVGRHAHVRNFKRPEVNGVKSTERAARFGIWAMACMGNADAKAYCEQNGLVLKLHQTGDNSLGGFLVPEEFGTDLIDLRLEYGVFRRNAKSEGMTSDTKKVPRRTGGLTAYFVGEGQAGTESNKGWDQVSLTAKDLMVIARMTNQLSMDAVVNIGDDLAGEIGYAFALKEDQCGFNGDGSSTYGGIVGVTTALTTINGVDDGGGIVVGAGNAYSELVLADFHKVIGRTPTYARRAAKWYVSPNFHDSVMQRLLTAAGGNSIRDLQAGGQPVFLGYPVELAEVLPTTEANSQVCALFGDLAKAAMFGDRAQEMIDFSTQATVGGQSLWERAEVGVRGIERFDINAHDLGTSTVAGPVVGLITAAS